jgi:hypothetical protein
MLPCYNIFNDLPDSSFHTYHLSQTPITYRQTNRQLTTIKSNYTITGNKKSRAQQMSDINWDEEPEPTQEMIDDEEREIEEDEADWEEEEMMRDEGYESDDN